MIFYSVANPEFINLQFICPLNYIKLNSMTKISLPIAISGSYRDLDVQGDDYKKRKQSSTGLIPPSGG